MRSSRQQGLRCFGKLNMTEWGASTIVIPTAVEGSPYAKQQATRIEMFRQAQHDGVGSEYHRHPDRSGGIP